MKRIHQLVTTRDAGFSIDLEDAELSVVVTPNSGDILLYEGDGPDRLSGFCIPGKAVRGFRTTSCPEGVSVSVSYRANGKAATHCLGVSADVRSVETWVARVNHIYRHANARPRMHLHSRWRSLGSCPSPGGSMRRMPPKSRRRPTTPASPGALPIAGE